MSMLTRMPATGPSPPACAAGSIVTAGAAHLQPRVRPARHPVTLASVRLLDDKRFAPWVPASASPATHRLAAALNVSSV